MTITDLKIACNDKVAAASGLKVYGNDTTDGYTRPGFFTEIVPHGYTHQSKSYASSGATFKATLLEKTHDESYCLNLYEKIKCEMGMTLAVGGRKLLVGEISYEFIGEQLNILQVSVDFDWIERKEQIDTTPVADDVVVSVERKGE